MTNAGITLLYTALLALVLIALSIQVVWLRRKFHVGYGTGSEQPLGLAVRAHANFCEYVPMALLLLMLIELNALAPDWVLHALGVMLLIGRILHGFFGLNRSAGTSLGRFWGTSLTWLVLIVAAVAGLIGFLAG